MTKNEALKMAIEALELINEHAFRCGLANDAIQACKEALKQPAQEPVAWIKDWADGSREIVPANYDNSYPVYTHPAPSWQGNKEFVGLSDDEILEIDKSIDPKIIIGKGKTLFARAIEQALKEKNNAM